MSRRRRACRVTQRAYGAPPIKLMVRSLAAAEAAEAAAAAAESACADPFCGFNYDIRPLRWRERFAHTNRLTHNATRPTRPAAYWLLQLAAIVQFYATGTPHPTHPHPPPTSSSVTIRSSPDRLTTRRILRILSLHFHHPLEDGRWSKTSAISSCVRSEPV